MHVGKALVPNVSNPLEAGVRAVDAEAAIVAGLGSRNFVGALGCVNLVATLSEGGNRGARNCKRNQGDPDKMLHDALPISADRKSVRPSNMPLPIAR
jgi:hypothetical protein